MLFTIMYRNWACYKAQLSGFARSGRCVRRICLQRNIGKIFIRSKAGCKHRSKDPAIIEGPNEGRRENGGVTKNTTLL